LALLSFIVPLVIIVMSGDERGSLVALLLSIVCAVSAMIINRGAAQSRLRWLNAAVATLGGLVGAYLVWTLIGSCGLQVIWNSCRP
jgi:hypothetical protein